MTSARKLRVFLCHAWAGRPAVRALYQRFRTFQPQVLCLVVVSLVTVIVCSEVFAQTETWKRQNDRGNRYEGRIEIPVARPDLDLLSFVGLLEPFASDVTLKIGFFLPEDQPVFIYGRELQEQRQYWMEAKPGTWHPKAWNEFVPWPTGEVLSREGIPAGNLGVVVRLDTETMGDGGIAPAFVYHSALPAGVITYTLYLRPDWTLKTVTCALYRLANGQEMKEKEMTLPGEKIGGVPFPVQLAAKDLPEGRMRLVLQGAYKNRLGGPLREFTFYHQPRIGK